MPTTSEPKWTVRNTVKFAETDKETHEFSLCYEGKACHVLTGDRSNAILQRYANDLNEQGYEPKFEKGKPLLSMNQTEKIKNAFYSSPELSFQQNTL